MRPLPMGDYHVHSRFSDGEDDLAAYAERALELGLPELGFAEHLAPDCLADDACCPRERLEEYLAAVRDTAARYPGLHLLCGVEVDYAPEAAAETLALLAAFPFDYTICAIHFVDGFSIDEERFLAADGWQDVDRVWRRYYETLTKAALTGAFDVVAHLDLPKKFGLRPTGDMSGLEDAALRAIAAMGMSIEINTSGLDRHPVAESYPCGHLLARANVLGIEVVFGSDAHRAVDVGARFEEARDAATVAGYQSSLRLSNGDSVALR